MSMRPFVCGTTFRTFFLFLFVETVTFCIAVWNNHSILHFLASFGDLTILGGCNQNIYIYIWRPDPHFCFERWIWKFPLTPFLPNQFQVLCECYIHGRDGDALYISNNLSKHLKKLTGVFPTLTPKTNKQQKSIYVRCCSGALHDDNNIHFCWTFTNP